MNAVTFTKDTPQIIIAAKSEPKQLRGIRLDPTCQTLTLEYNEKTNNPMETGGPIEYTHIIHDSKVADAWRALLLADLGAMVGVKDVDAGVEVIKQ